MTQDEFGKKLGVSRDVVNNMERGRVNIGEDRIKLIYSVFSINEEWLRTGEGDPEKNTSVEFGDICGEIGINDPKAKEAILKYSKLSPADKELFWNFVERFIRPKAED